MKKGDIILIPFPFTNLQSKKTRPALVLISDVFDVTVAFITSKAIDAGEYDLPIEPDSSNGLKVDSIIKLSKIATIDKELALGELGKLSVSDLGKVDKKLISAFRIGL